MSGGLGEQEMLREHEPQEIENSPRKITKNEENLIVLFIIKL